MNRLKWLFLIMIGLSFSAQAENGLVSIPSAHNVAITADRLETSLNSKGMTVFTRINHAAAAKAIGQVLRPTELVIFGNAKVGTPLMLCDQTVGIDLPQKALIHEDARGQVWLSYNDPHYLASRHQLNGCDAVLEKIAGALKQFALAATK